MITYTEENATKLSATKKDFYQIWNELLETASKISERWDPTNTPEGDPGIVLLKVLTAVADKLNYNLDMNALEAFMPSAAQLESMRKLTEMLGYTMKYYQSATTDIQLNYSKAEIEGSEIPVGQEICIDKFTNIKNKDDTINYVTLEDRYLSRDNTSVVIPCIEGELVECETSNGNAISLLQLDDNNRYYLPETQIAENGIFVTNLSSIYEQAEWKKVDNLNVEPLNTHCYKFGFDSAHNLPYIQFPDDISDLIGDGLKIRYIRTNGINGNISPRTLCKMTEPASWASIDTSTASGDVDWLNVDNYSVTNLSAAKNGANAESINDAYNSYKKTIGTFNTLVTCRDYMNKIYQLTTNETNTINLVSNIIVSDIRDDINNSITLCTFGKYGIEYNKKAIQIDTENATPVAQSKWKEWLNDSTKPTEGDFQSNPLYKIVDDTTTPTKIYGYYKVVFDGNNYQYEEISVDALNNFDLMFYPFKNVYGLNTKLEYTRSFKYDDSNITEIKSALEESKTMSHNIRLPNPSDIACIKNYFNLNAKITTNKKVNILEQQSILNNVYTKIYEAFNMHKVDFGEEISYDAIQQVMETADPRIKNVSLDDPTLITKFCTVAGGEYTTSGNTTSTDPLTIAGDICYNKLVLNNVLAGRIPLFNYNESFKPDYTELEYPAWGPYSDQHYELLYPNAINESKTNGIANIESHFDIQEGAKDIELRENEIVQFRLPNLKTIKTYPAYVNYYLKLNVDTAQNTPALPATMQMLETFLTANDFEQWDEAVNWTSSNNTHLREELTGINDNDQFITAKNAHSGRLYKATGTAPNITYTYIDTYDDNIHTYYALDELSSSNFARWTAYIQTIDSLEPSTTSDPIKLTGLYYRLPADLSKSVGYLVDMDHRRYIDMSDKAWKTSSRPAQDYCIQVTHTETKPSTETEYGYTANGLGQNGVNKGIDANEEYLLKSGEYLLINYTSGSSTEGSQQTVVNEIVSKGHIIKPNFELIDSASYKKSGHSYNKTSGYDFSNLLNVSNPEGMFTFGTNEQVEIRDFVLVHLDEFVNLYWILNEEIPAADNRIYFPWNEEPATPGGTDYTAYTLKEGEYLFYTNKNKTDLAYYGAGTKIKKSVKTPSIYKSVNDSNISTADIMNSGLSAAIPWRAYNLANDNNIKRELILTEYQYKTLTEGAILQAVGGLGDEDATAIDIPINSEPQECATAYWKNPDSEGTEYLPKVSFGADDTSGIYWEVYTKLALNMSPTQSQQLYEDAYTKDYIILKYQPSEISPVPNVTIEPHNYETVSIKANKIIQSTMTNTPTITQVLTDTELETIYDCQLKIFKSQDVTNVDNSSISLNTFGNGDYTKLTFSEMREDDTDDTAYATFNTVIPGDCFGLVMIQNNTINNEATGCASIKIIPVSAQSDYEPVIYNYYGDEEITGSSEQWWDGYEESNIANYAIEDPYGIYTCTDATTKAALELIKDLLYTRITLDSEPASHNLVRCEKVNGNDVYYQYTEVGSGAITIGTTYYKLIDEGSNGTDRYYLKPGINVIKLRKSCKIAIFSDVQKKDTLIISNLDIIYNTDSGEDISEINPKLCYKSTTNGYSVKKQILADINKLDQEHKFYYNTLINSELSLDLNPNDPEDTMENPLNWFNYNNTANKFVISEINADYLSTGITIARNSKL